MKPGIGDYPLYYDRYVSLVSASQPLFTQLEGQVREIDEFFSSVTEEETLFRYADGKWSMKEVLQHIIDTERVFAYRAMSIARGEQQSLPGFDENAYVQNCHADARPVDDILKEFLYLRKSTLHLLNGLSEDVLENKGVANSQPITCRSLFWIMAGHCTHHLQILRSRYLKK